MKALLERQGTFKSPPPHTQTHMRAKTFLAGCRPEHSTRDRNPQPQTLNPLPGREASKLSIPNPQRVQAALDALDPNKLLVGKEFEFDMDRVHDVMGKYLLENLLCLNPADRMPSKDVALYAAQIGEQADYYGQAHSSDDEV